MTSVRIDSAAIAKILKEDMRGPVDELAARIAAAVDTGSVDAPVKVTSYTTDRATAVVAIAHPAGMAIQAKHGALTKAAASVGLTVRDKKQ